MKKEQKLNMIFNDLADSLNITRTMMDKAEVAYNALGQHIKNCNKDWDVNVYPQGSFQLGTVIKPLGDEEQYDVDLVVVVKTPRFNAEKLRKEILDALESHGRYEGKIENKKPCIRIQYADSAQFHMDVASAQEVATSKDTSINIARFDGAGNYYYDISNPKGYIEWFKSTMKFGEMKKTQGVLYEKGQTEVEELDLSKARTPLQKAIQILKRHRDIFFYNRKDSEARPSSIIITTLCAMAYRDLDGKYEKDNIYLTVVNMLKEFSSYIKRDIEGHYYLKNPSNPKENFLKKWNDNPALVMAFEQWISKAKADIIHNPDLFIEENPKAFRESLDEAFGVKETQIALEQYGKRFYEYAQEGQLKYDAFSANVVLPEDGGKPYRKHTYFGGEC